MQDVDAGIFKHMREGIKGGFDEDRFGMRMGFGNLKRCVRAWDCHTWGCPRLAGLVWQAIHTQATYVGHGGSASLVMHKATPYKPYTRQLTDSL